MNTMALSSSDSFLRREGVSVFASRQRNIGGLGWQPQEGKPTNANERRERAIITLSHFTIYRDYVRLRVVKPFLYEGENI